MQACSHAFTMKSQLWLLNPRSNLPSIFEAVEVGFEKSGIEYMGHPKPGVRLRTPAK
jgi:TPP-dependent indolepyruvate ferredoxin oxidoreductase alpha subunit